MSNGSFFDGGHRGGRRGRKPPTLPPQRPSPLLPLMETYDNPRYPELFNDFTVFHDKNPEVYWLISDYAGQAIRAGHTEYAIAAIFEVIVWDHSVRTNDPDLEFKMPHNHRAFYARMWARNNPEHAGFFQLNMQSSRWLVPPTTDKRGKLI